MRYPIVIATGTESSAFGVIVPDLPGCFSAGDSFQEAIDCAKEAIELHVEALLAEGTPLPAMQPLERHRANPDFSGWVWALVDIDMSRLADVTERVNITLPRRVLHIIDDAAKRAGESRSAYLARVGVTEAQRVAH